MNRSSYRLSRPSAAVIGLTLVVSVLAVGAALAQPKTGAPQPASATNIPTTDALSSLLMDRNLQDVFGSGQIITPDQLLAKRGVTKPGWVLPEVSGIPSLTPHPALRDLTQLDTVARIGGKELTIGQDVISGSKPAKVDVAVTIDAIDALARGQYLIIFRYTIHNNKLAMPLRFGLYVEGDASPHMSWIGWVHNSGPATQRQAYVVALLAGTTQPLTTTTPKVGVTAVDGKGKSLGQFTKDTAYTFVKRYEDITRDDICDYLSQANTKSSHSDTSIQTLLDLQSEFRLEPALLFIKTNRGNYVKALVRAEKTSPHPYQIAVWDARTYAKDQATFDSWPFMAKGAPSNTEYLRRFGRGGYVFDKAGLDLDQNGEDTSRQDQDVWLEGKATSASDRLQAQNGSALAYCTAK